MWVSWEDADNLVAIAMLGTFGISVVKAQVRRLRRDARVGWDDALERPWRMQAAQPFPTLAEQHIARERAREVARTTLGPGLLADLDRDGYLDLASTTTPGTSYRIRPGRRIEIRRLRPGQEPGSGPKLGLGPLRRRAPGTPRWQTRRYICVYPSYTLPAVEFTAQLYLLLRDEEQRVLATGVVQPFDGPIANVF